MSSVIDLVDVALKELIKVTEQHALAVDKVSSARTEETSTINRMNEAQKKLDTIIADLRKGAPRDSDWGRNKVKGAQE